MRTRGATNSMRTTPTQPNESSTNATYITVNFCPRSCVTAFLTACVKEDTIKVINVRP